MNIAADFLTCSNCMTQTGETSGSAAPRRCGRANRHFHFRFCLAQAHSPYGTSEYGRQRMADVLVSKSDIWSSLSMCCNEVFCGRRRRCGGEKWELRDLPAARLRDGSLKRSKLRSSAARFRPPQHDADTQQVTVTPSGSTSASCSTTAASTSRRALRLRPLVQAARPAANHPFFHHHAPRGHRDGRRVRDRVGRQRLGRGRAAGARARFKIEKALMLGTNYGIAYGFNSLFFRRARRRTF